MPYFRVDDNFGNHPKVLRIPRRDRLGCIGLWTLAGSWCSRQLTDGHLDGHMLAEFGATRKHADALVAVGLWRATDDGYVFHDWIGWQFSREEVLKKREEEAEKKRRWREKKAAERDTSTGESPGDTPGTDQGTPESVHQGVPHLSPGVSRSTYPIPPHPTPSHPIQSSPTGTTRMGHLEGEDAPEVDAHARSGPLPLEPPLCRRHVGQDRDSVPPCTACGRLRTQWETQTADADRPPPRPTWCGTCDEHTRQVELDDRTVARCPDCHPSLALVAAS